MISIHDIRIVVLRYCCQFIVVCAMAGSNGEYNIRSKQTNHNDRLIGNIHSNKISSTSTYSPCRPNRTMFTMRTWCMLVVVEISKRFADMTSCMAFTDILFRNILNSYCEYFVLFFYILFILNWRKCQCRNEIGECLLLLPQPMVALCQTYIHHRSLTI